MESDPPQMNLPCTATLIVNQSPFLEPLAELL